MRVGNPESASGDLAPDISVVALAEFGDTDENRDHNADREDNLHDSHPTVMFGEWA
ncbi:hypothetical protein NN3_26780 [Nocardia neocaledoniensis NBRC 108232]|nr:hypothetical protein NN3_26780 [Nocardia neocaledoniensis NBRC 108232]